MAPAATSTMAPAAATPASATMPSSSNAVSTPSTTINTTADELMTDSSPPQQPSLITKVNIIFKTVGALAVYSYFLIAFCATLCATPTAFWTGTFVPPTALIGAVQAFLTTYESKEVTPEVSSED